jgi:aspartate racemase
MSNHSIKLGIVGGLGARGSADTLNHLVRLTPVGAEGNHHDITYEQKALVEAVSVACESYLPTHRKFHVFDTLSRMDRNGCTAALLPCFITHTFIEELCPEFDLNIISMVDAIKVHLTANYADAKRVGVLTSRYVRQSGLFNKALAPGQQALYPDPDAELALIDAIYGTSGFKANGDAAKIKLGIENAVGNLIAKGAEVIVPGMTEVPLALQGQVQFEGVDVLQCNEIYAGFALQQMAALHSKPFKVGVLGGIGPAATVDFMSKIISGTHAIKDQDHIKVLVEQNPQIPDRTANLIGDGTDPTLALYSTAKKLERGGADIIAIPCNTAHAYVDRIQKHLDIPIVNMLTETADHIRKLEPTVSRIGVLASSGLIWSGLYQDMLAEAGLSAIVPTEVNQAKVMDAIYSTSGVKAGFMSGACTDLICEVIESLRQQSAEAIILACTELPLIQLPKEITQSIRLIDPTEVLANKCITLSKTWPLNS